MSATVRRDQDGIWFNGDTGGAAPAGARGGGGGSPTPFPPPGWSEQTRVTQIQWDNIGHALQVKTATVLVKDETESSEWTNLLNFVEFDE